MQRHEAKVPPVYWHGGAPGRSQGDLLLSFDVAETTAVDTGAWRLQRGYGFGWTRRDRVYFTNDQEIARGYAARHRLVDPETGVVVGWGSLYRVEAVGDVEVDDDMPSDSRCAPAARVLAVEEEVVALDLWQANRRLAMLQTWADGSHIYGSDGSFRPSPEMRAAGLVTTRLDDAFPPFTPVEMIEADAAGRPAPDRPGPGAHPGISVVGNRVSATRLRYIDRLRRLARSGVDFARGAARDADEVAAVLGRGLVPGEQTVVARLEDGWVIGVAVLEAWETDLGVSLAIVRVAVTPDWRGRGVATVLVGSAVSNTPRLQIALGHCPVRLQSLVIGCGFTTLRPGVALPHPGPDGPTLMETDSGDCWFFRQGPH